MLGIALILFACSNNQTSEDQILSKYLERYAPDKSKAYMEYSIRFNKAGDFEKGFRYLDMAVELDPVTHLGYRGWIRLRKMRDYDQALNDFGLLDSLTPDVIDAPWGEDIDFLRGECYFGKRNYSQAIQSFSQSIGNHGEDWVDIQTFVYLGLSEYKLGHYEIAITQFVRALEQSANTCEAFFGLAKTYEKMGQKSKAIEYAKLAEENIAYKREDVYNEYLNEIYLLEIQEYRKYLDQ